MTESIVEPINLEGQALTEYINNLNGKVLRGEQVSDDELRAAVLALRTRRKFASASSGAGKKAAAPKPIADIDLMSLFDKP